MTPTEFEEFVVGLFRATVPLVNDLRVTLHETVRGIDGEYDFDGTIRYRLLGIDFLVLVEAKMHRSPIKREVIQTIHSKLESVGAHKAVVVSTSPFQRGALELARVHGVALVTVTEGRFTYEARSAGGGAELSREQARELFQLETFVGHCYSAGSTGGSTQVTLMSPQHPEHIVTQLLGARFDP